MLIIDELLRDDYSIEEAESLQFKYQEILKNSQKSTTLISLKETRTVAGVDISYYNKDGNEYGVACAVLWDKNQERIITYGLDEGKINFTYKPGFLGFRECNLLAKTIKKLPFKPDLIMCDGHGIIHPKRFGEAVHLGLALNIPSIGIAKKAFIGYYDWDKREKLKGNKTPIWAKQSKFITENEMNELLGYLTCLNNNSKPVFISEGYKITLDLAVNVCFDTTKDHRQPEPLYLADKFSREEVKKYTN